MVMNKYNSTLLTSLEELIFNSLTIQNLCYKEVNLTGLTFRRMGNLVSSEHNLHIKKKFSINAKLLIQTICQPPSSINSPVNIMNS